MQAPNRAIHLIHCSEHFFKMWNVGLGVDILTENRVDHGDFIVRFSKKRTSTYHTLQIIEGMQGHHLP